MSSDRFAEAVRLLDRAAGAAYPGAVLAVLWRGDVVVRRATGRTAAREGAPAVVPETVYDLASLTKVVATLPLVLQAVAEGRVALDDPVPVHLPECPHHNVTIRHLLTHTSGLPAWIPFYLRTMAGDAIVRGAAATPLVAQPGSQVTYSDIGFVLLGEIARRTLGAPLDVLARKRLYAPLEMTHTGYRPVQAAAAGQGPGGAGQASGAAGGGEDLRAIAPTEDGTAVEQHMARDPRWVEAGRRHTWRRYLIWGEVHDSNAHAMGGVSGHAGLFGTAEDLLAYARMWLAGGRGPHGPVLEPALVRDAITPQTPPPNVRGLGWALTGEHGWWRDALSPGAFGHTGFTGTSIVVDQARDLAIVLLSNAVHLGRDRTGILSLRPAIAAAVAAAIA
ncbi:MAG TPA: serine hydrolase [bacterium]|nr:serine hydrolase [bacterium]